MWRESSSINAVNLVKKFVTIQEISNFSQGVTFFGAPCISEPSKDVIGLAYQLNDS